MKIGKMRVDPVDCGRFKLDGGVIFGVVPRPLWEKAASADERNRIILALRAMLIRSDSRRVLVDTGVGDHMPEKLRDIYGLEEETCSVGRALAGAGLDCSEVTDVVLTHLHFDHAGGATAPGGGGAVVPVFANATYYVQEKQYRWALDPSERDRASYFREQFIPLEDAGVLRRLDGEQEIIPGVTVLPVDGHTPGQQLVKVASGGECLLYCADLIPTAAHIAVPWTMGYDLQPLVTLKEKKDILRCAAAGGWTLFYEHDPQIISSRVSETGKSFEIADPVTRA